MGNQPSNLTQTWPQGHHWCKVEEVGCSSVPLLGGSWRGIAMLAWPEAQDSEPSMQNGFQTRTFHLCTSTPVPPGHPMAGAGMCVLLSMGPVLCLTEKSAVESRMPVQTLPLEHSLPASGVSSTAAQPVSHRAKAIITCIPVMTNDAAKGI